MIDTSTWKEFVVSDILNVEQTKSVVAKADLKEGNIPYVSRTTNNNGYQSYCGNKDKINKGNCITIGAETAIAFYQPEDFVAGNKVYRLSREGLSEKHYIFLISMLNKKTGDYSYSDARIPAKIKAETITLPATPSGEPDWNFMEQYIVNIAEKTLSNLDTYLTACGLNDYKLTEEDKEVLSASPKWEEFRIGNLFDVINNPQLDKENFTFSENSSYPYFTRTENNNGILGYVDYLDDKHKIQGNSLAVGMISMRFHYMEHDFYAGQFTKTLIPKFDEFNETLATHFITILNKHTPIYKAELVRHFANLVKETMVKLPVLSDGTPDFEYMKKYIKTIKKIKFKNVVEWKNKEMETTKQLITAKN